MIIRIFEIFWQVEKWKNEPFYEFRNILSKFLSSQTTNCSLKNTFWVENNQSGVRIPDGCRLYSATCRIRTKWLFGRRTPLYFMTKNQTFNIKMTFLYYI